ncbi:flagellin-like hook-associated protein FlgL [Maritalea mobilis]|uniref:Flagellin n=1 Tax=Maritalea mobilis TaxID=483324 RepID=A0A4R6W171_9HYPH|nr:flagellin [Maritalea mobilis]TDQ66685.1 flagellin-like hook-associated protein FlgL [Maritalea mobilis]
MSNIQLSSAVRQNLLSLQSTADMMSKTQNRLATGLKVNSALDNPSSFFTASALNNRSNDLGGLLDDMGQSIQTLKAADEGIKSITKLVEAAKGKANQALQSSSTADRSKFATEYNELLGQIEQLAKDAGYNGKNLLAGTGNDLDVVFNEDGRSKLDISAVNYTDVASSLGLVEQVDGPTTPSVPGSVTISAADLHAAATGFTGNDIYITDDAYTTDVTPYPGLDLNAGASANDTASNVETEINSAGIAGLSASFDSGSGQLTISFEDHDIRVLSRVSGGPPSPYGFDETSSNYAPSVAGSTMFETDEIINAELDKLNTALNTLRSQASTFGTNLTVVENRQNFTKSLINTLQEGAGKLTLADTNEEGANLLALQTRQQLSSTSLSFASQADQNVLRLF